MSELKMKHKRMDKSTCTCRSQGACHQKVTWQSSFSILGSMYTSIYYIYIYLYIIYSQKCETLSPKHSFHPFPRRISIKTAWVNASTILPRSFLNQHPRPILSLFYIHCQNKNLLASRDNNTLPYSFLETKALITYKSSFVSDKNRFL